jgi:hypothetical protein
MQELRVVAVEDGALVAVAGDGSRYRVEVDEVQIAQLRRARGAAAPAGRKVAPREIQAHIRAGMSAQDVATLTGAELDYVERFEGPVLAEREYIVESALNVAVRTAGDTDPASGSSFGSVIRTRLADGGAQDERWAAWKDAETGWTVKLTFEAGAVEHDARWTFDPRTAALSPLNAEAVSLSQQGEMPPSLIPRLRAVDLGERQETGRFDSGAFRIEEGDLDGPLIAAPRSRAEDAVPMNQTADLLEALRRRRGERDSRPFAPEPEPEQEPEPRAAIRLVDVPLAGLEDDSAIDLLDEAPADDDGIDIALAEDEQEPAPRQEGTAQAGARRSRAAMPSWDEIVFGARTSDDG